MSWRDLSLDDLGNPIIPSDKVVTSITTSEEEKAIRASTGGNDADTVITYVRKRTVTTSEYRGYTLASATTLIDLIESQSAPNTRYTASASAIGGGGYTVTENIDVADIWSVRI